jgi:putative transposase
LNFIHSLIKSKTAYLTPALYREHGMSSSSFYKWHSKLGDIDIILMARIKELEDVNYPLKNVRRRRFKAEIINEAIEFMQDQIDDGRSCRLFNV